MAVITPTRESTAHKLPNASSQVATTLVSNNGGLLSNMRAPNEIVTPHAKRETIDMKVKTFVHLGKRKVLVKGVTERVYVKNIARENIAGIKKLQVKTSPPRSVANQLYHDNQSKSDHKLISQSAINFQAYQ